MRKIFKNSKFKISLQLAVALVGVFTATISTHAWYQLNQAPIQSSMITTTPNISVVNSNVYGHKINQGIGENGFIDYGSDDVAKFAATGVTETNHHQDDEDVNFNVPDSGIGYYLVKKNPGGTFKYKYTTDGSTYTSYSTKFTEYDNTYLSRAYIGSYTVAANDEFRVMHYTFADSKTVNTQLKISTAYGGSPTVDATTGDVKVATPGTYKVWLDFTNNDLSFEATSITSQNVNIRALNPKKSAGTTSNTTYTKIIINNNSVGWSFNTIKLESLSFSSNYNKAAFDYFVEQEYTTSVGTWDYQRTTKGYKIDNTTYYLATAISSGSGTFYLPTWVTTGKICLCNSSNQIYFFYLDNLFKSSAVSYAHGSGQKYRHQATNSLNAIGKTVTFNCYHYQNYDSSYTDFSDKWNSTSSSTYGTWYGSGTEDATFTATVSNNSGNKTWTTQTVAIAYVDTSGTSIKTGSSSNIINVNMTQVPTSSASISGYEYSAVYYSRTNTFNSKTSTSLSAYLQVQGGMTIYLVYNRIYTISLYYSYFIVDKDGTTRHSNISSDLITSYTRNAGTAYTPESHTETLYKNDDTNGIYYKFNREATTTKWYTNEICTTEYTNGTSLSGALTLYAKYIADPRVTSSTHKTFYVDITHSYAYTSGVRQDGSYWAGVQFRGTDGTTKFVNAAKVATGLYRLTVPVSWNFKVGNATYTGNTHDHSVQVSTNNITTSNISILALENCNTGSEHGVHWAEPASSASYGAATIKISSDGSTWKDPITKSTSIFNTTMDFGDGSANNYFVYEHGLQIPSGWYIDVVVSGSSVLTNTSYGQVSNGKYYDPGDRPYISSSGTYLKTDNYSGDARFNFYITGSGKLSIAMVPNLGNGYYIMPYNSTYKTNNFIGSIKMTTNGEKKATYDGFYVRTANEKYYIRSYLDAVDVKYVSLNDSSGNVSIQDSNSSANDYGVLTFASTGYYSIVVQNNTIYTSTYSVDTSFKLNKLDTSKVTYAKDIWSQKTSLVLEIPFTCANSYSSEMSLNVQSSLNDFIGVSLYVTKPFSTSKAYAVGDTCIYNSKLYVFTSAHSAGAWNNAHASESDPYHFMRGTNANTRSTMYNSLSYGTEITDKAGASVSNSDGTCYAYILIDYLPTNTNAANSPASGNSAYSGSTCTSGVYSGDNFSSTYLNRSISFYLVAEQE